MPKIIRSLPMKAEWRVEESDDGVKIAGYAAKFNELSEEMMGFREKIAPGAFAASLERGDDVRALWNHNDDYVLGRTASGTLRLAEDDIGLKYEIDPPDTQWARDRIESIKRGDVNQSSFGFVVVTDDVTREDGNEIRTLLEVDLFDVSPVTYPAYPQTESEIRSFLVNRQLNKEDEAGLVEQIRRRLDFIDSRYC